MNNTPENRERLAILVVEQMSLDDLIEDKVINLQHDYKHHPEEFDADVMDMEMEEI